MEDELGTRVIQMSRRLYCNCLETSKYHIHNFRCTLEVWIDSEQIGMVAQNVGFVKRDLAVSLLSECCCWHTSRWSFSGHEVC